MYSTITKNWDVNEVRIEPSRDNSILHDLCNVFSATMNGMNSGCFCDDDSFTAIGEYLGVQSIWGAYSAIRWAQMIHADDSKFIHLQNTQYSEDHDDLPAYMVLDGDDIKIEKSQLRWRKKNVAIFTLSIEIDPADIQWILIRKIKRSVPLEPKIFKGLRNDLNDLSKNYLYEYTACIYYADKPVDEYGILEPPIFKAVLNQDDLKEKLRKGIREVED